MNKKHQFAQDFMKMINIAELKALSKLSLEQPLSDRQFKRMMELKGGLKNGM